MELNLPSMGLPSVALPNEIKLPPPILEMPKADLPSYRPLVAPPAEPSVPAPQVQEPEEESVESKPQAPSAPQVRVSDNTFEEKEEVVELILPGTEVSIPMPSASIVTAAATTSVISVAATLTATSMFKKLVTAFKPVIKKIARVLDSGRGAPQESWGRQRLRERYLRRQ